MSFVIFFHSTSHRRQKFFSSSVMFCIDTTCIATACYPQPTLKQMTVLSLSASCIKRGLCLATAFAEISCSVCVCVGKTPAVVPASCRNHTQLQRWPCESSSFHRNPSQKGSFELSPVSIMEGQAAHLLLYVVGILRVWQEWAGCVEFT